MLVNRQIVYVTCDIKGCNNRQFIHKGFLAPDCVPYDSHLPNGWIKIADTVICPKHTATLHVDGVQIGTLRSPVKNNKSNETVNEDGE